MLSAEAAPVNTYIVESTRLPGETTTAIAGHVATEVTQMNTNPPEEVMLSMGSNNICWAQVSLEADYTTILDALHTAWPTARLFVTRSWIRGYDACADTHATAVDAVLVGRGAYAFVGPDERVILKGADNGATNTTDGVHPSPAGSAALAADWITRLGY